MSLARRRIMSKTNGDILWLYKDGDECISTTGGFAFGTSDNRLGTPYNTGSYIYLTSNRSATGWYNRNYAYTIKSIDLTRYNYLCTIFDGYRKYNPMENAYSVGVVIINGENPATGKDSRPDYSSTDYHPFPAYSRYAVGDKSPTYTQFLDKINITNLIGFHCIEAINQINNEMKIYKMWLE